MGGNLKPVHRAIAFLFLLFLCSLVIGQRGVDVATERVESQETGIVPRTVRVRLGFGDCWSLLVKKREDSGVIERQLMEP